MNENKELTMKAREHDISDATSEAAEEAVKVMGEGATGIYKKIEDGVVSGYKKIEDGVVSGFNKVTDKCVEVLFAKEGESVADARKRLSGKE